MRVDPCGQISPERCLVCLGRHDACPGEFQRQHRHPELHAAVATERARIGAKGPQLEEPEPLRRGNPRFGNRIEVEERVRRVH